MGIVATRPRAHLDSNVVSALVTDQVARAYLQELRRNGYDLAVSPSIIREIAHARKRDRDRMLKAVLASCQVATNVQAPEVVNAELDALSANSVPPPIPIMAISKFRRLLNEKEAILALGDLHEPEHPKSAVAILDEYRKGARKLPLAATFREFYESEFLMYAQVRIESWSARTKNRLLLSKYSYSSLTTCTGLVAHVSLMLANLYRARTRTSRKGEGSLTDVRPVVEAARSGIFLTRDKELVECFKLISTLVEFRPHIELVPR